MNSRIKCTSAFTVLELFVVVLLLLLLATLFFPVLFRRPHGGCRINCTNNLKQTGLAFKTWSIDNQDRFPMQVSTNQGGTMELTNGPLAFAHFQVMSNELSTPKVLLCPMESKRVWATNFEAGFSNTNLSYFAGLDAMDTNSLSFLCGDRTLTNGIGIRGNVLTIQTNQTLAWTSELHLSESRPHKGLGNLGLADGSVQQLDANGLNTALQRSAMVNRLAMPYETSIP